MRLTSRDPQTHAHNAVDKLLWRPVEAYDFQLDAADGRRISLSQFRGRTVVFAFGFTHCPSICPATLSHFAAIRKALPESAREGVQFLFISVDPERDSPAKMQEYADFFDPKILGLTGSLTDLRALAYKYKGKFTKLASEGDPRNYFVDHSADAYIIAPDGKWVMSYPFEKLSATQELAADIARVGKN